MKYTVKLFTLVFLSAFFLPSQSHSLTPFLPFEQCVGIPEKTVKFFSKEKQNTLIKKALNGTQGSFFTQKIEPFCCLKNGSSSFSFNVVEGNGHRQVNITALQADPSNKGALFQVASNLDCLEADGGKKFLITDYIYYNTQGEAAVLSATPGIIDRMYLQPDIQLLKSFNWNGAVPLSAGYFPYYSNLDNQFKNMSLQNIFNAASTVLVGVQHNVTVTSGFRSFDYANGHSAEPVFNKDQRITQVLTAALDPYHNNTHTQGYKNFARTLLHASYKGTFDVARKLGIKKVYLTLIGGGVFKNDYRWISEAIKHACQDLAVYPESAGMEIVLIIYSKPSVGQDEWGVFSHEIKQLCQQNNGSWNTL
ncbi:MAG: hypothetical protein ACJAZS_000345 [Alteromonas naphthalenivorans]|jgi:hypothetical protein